MKNLIYIYVSILYLLFNSFYCLGQRVNGLNFQLQNRIAQEEKKQQSNHYKNLKLSSESVNENQIDLMVKGDLNKISNFVSSNGGVLKYYSGDIMSIRLPASKIGAFAANAENIGLQRIEYNENKGQVLNDSMINNINAAKVHQGIGLPKGYDGEGVILGFIDTGIDFNHEDFKDENGKTRIIKLWDQTITSPTSTPKPYGYGQEWSAADIDAGRCTHNTSLQGGHGTHVAGIAAGNGRAIGKYKGLAPKAQIVMVASEFNPATRSWTSTVADGIKYIFDIADSLGKPCVINTSVGTLGGSKDGKDLDAQFIDNLIKEKPGRAVVGAVGNSGTSVFHLGYEVNSDTAFTWFARNTSLNFGPYAPNGAVFFELYADTNDFNNVNFTLGVDKSSPIYERRGQLNFLNIKNYFNGNFKLDQNGVYSDTIKNANGNRLAIVHAYGEINNGVYLLQLIVNPDSITNYKWRFATTGSGKFDIWSNVKNTGSSDISYISTSPNASDFADMVYYKNPDVNKTLVSSWACSPNVITVGAYKNRDYFTDIDGNTRSVPLSGSIGSIYPSSSYGPTRTGILKPDITAPGWGVISTGSATTLYTKARSSVAKGAKHMELTGTSMASPMVAGIVALYMQKSPKANYSEIKNAIINSAVKDNYTGQTENNLWGHGKVNALAALSSTNYFVNLQNNGNDTICSGDSIILTAPAGYSNYRWNDNSRTSSVVIKESGIYSVIVTNGDGLEGISDSITIFVKPSPNSKISNTSKNLCEGKTITFKGNPEGGTGLYVTHLWSGDKILLSKTNDSTTIFDAAHSGNYFLKYQVNDSNGCSASDSISFTIHPNPQIELTEELTACAGDSVLIKPLSTNGKFPYTHLWQGDVNNINLYDTAHPIFKSDYAGMYKFTYLLTDSNGCTSNDSTKIFVNEKPTVKLGGGGNICPGDSIAVNFNFSGKSPWNFNYTDGSKTILDSSINSTYSFYCNKNATYRIISLSDANCSINLNLDTLSVKVLDKPTTDISPKISTLCSGNIVAFHGNPRGGSENYQLHLWQGDDSWLSSTNDSLTNFSSSTPGNYNLKYIILDSNGCSNSDSISFTVYQTPLITLEEIIQICAGDSLSVKPDISGGTKPFTHLWDGTETIIFKDIAQPYFKSDSAGTFNIKYTLTDSVGCTASDSLLTVIVNKPTIKLSSGGEICQDDSLLVNYAFTGKSPWKFSYTDGNKTITDSSFISSYSFYCNYNANYRITELSDANCSAALNTDSVNIKILNKPHVAISPKTPSICSGNSLRLKGNPSGGSGIYSKHLWTGDNNLMSINEDSLANFNASIPGNYLLKYLILDTNGCSSADSMSITVNDTPSLEMDKNIKLCSADSFVIKPLFRNGTLPYSYLWVGDINNIDSVNNSNAIFKSDTAGSYKLYFTLTDSNKCTASDSVTITVNNKPRVKLSDSGNICQGDSLPVIFSFEGTKPWKFNYTDGHKIIADSSLDDSYNFYVNYDANYKILELSDSNCAAESISDSTFVKLLNKPDAHISFEKTALCVEKNIIIHGNPSGGSGIQNLHFWFGDTSLLSKTNDSTTLFKSANPGKYFLKYLVYDSNGCKAMDSTYFTVNTNPIINLDKQISICASDTLLLNPNINGGTLPYNHKWEGDNKSITKPDTLNPYFKSDSAGIYKLTYILTDSNGCAANDSIRILVNEKPRLILNGGGNICPGDSIAVNFNFSGKSPWNFNYTDGNKTITDSSINQVYSFYCDSNSVFKILTLKDSMCISDLNMDSVIVFVGETPKNPILNLEADSICFGENYSIDVIDPKNGESYYVYSSATEKKPLGKCPYTFSPFFSSEYFLETQSSLGCIQKTPRTAFSLTLLDLPDAPEISSSRTYCYGDSIDDLTAIAKNGGLLSWYRDDSLSTLLDTGFTLTPLNLPGILSYYVTETKYGCRGSYNLTNIEINPIPEKPEIKLNGNEIFTLTEAHAYQWYLNGNEIKNANSKNHMAVTNGNYKLKITDVKGCYAFSDTLNLTLASILEPKSDIEVSVYPNPFNGKFTLEISRIFSDKATLSITDLMGKTILNKAIEKKPELIKMEMDLKEESKGIYFLKFQDGETIILRKIINN